MLSIFTVNKKGERKKEQTNEKRKKERKKEQTSEETKMRKKYLAFTSSRTRLACACLWVNVNVGYVKNGNK